MGIEIFIWDIFVGAIVKTPEGIAFQYDPEFKKMGLNLSPINLPIDGKEVFINEQKTLKQYTREIIKYYLKKNNNDVIAAAKDLDIGKSTIYKMLKNGELDSD